MWGGDGWMEMKGLVLGSARQPTDVTSAISLLFAAAVWYSLVLFEINQTTKSRDIRDQCLCLTAPLQPPQAQLEPLLLIGIGMMPILDLSITVIAFLASISFSWNQKYSQSSSVQPN